MRYLASGLALTAVCLCLILVWQPARDCSFGPVKTLPGGDAEGCSYLNILVLLVPLGLPFIVAG
jgi:hypothetical protein